MSLNDVCPRPDPTRCLNLSRLAYCGFSWYWRDRDFDRICRDKTSATYRKAVKHVYVLLANEDDI
jgi:hypothetical protein